MRSVNIVLGLEAKKSQTFGKQTVLDGKKVHQILFVSDLTKAPDGTDALTSVDAFLTLIDGKNEAIHEGIPVQLLDYQNQHMFPIEGEKIYWEKCKLDFPVTTNLAGKSIVFQVLYS